MALSKASGLSERPSHKSAQARANYTYTLLVRVILFAWSTDLLCNEALGSTVLQLTPRVPKQQHTYRAYVRITAMNSSS